MTEHGQPVPPDVPYGQPPVTQVGEDAPTPYPYTSTPYPAPVGQPTPQYYGARPTGQIGATRDTAACIVLCIVTLGIYSLYWFYKTHDEMKRHTGQGLGGGIAFLLAFFVGIVMPYLTSNEVGDLYGRAGQRPPVTWATGLWYFPGIFILIGPFVWFIQTNGALNSYWRSQGAA